MQMFPDFFAYSVVGASVNRKFQIHAVVIRKLDVLINIKNRNQHSIASSSIKNNSQNLLLVLGRTSTHEGQCRSAVLHPSGSVK